MCTFSNIAASPGMWLSTVLVFTSDSVLLAIPVMLSMRTYSLGAEVHGGRDLGIYLC